MRGSLSIVLAFALMSGLAVTAPAFSEEPSAVAPGHVPEPDGLHQGAMHGYTPNIITGGTVIDTTALAKLIDKAHPVLIDVAEADRKPPSMAAGMIWSPTYRSIPGATFLVGGGYGTDDPTYATDFKATAAKLTAGNLAKPIVTFCHPDCWGSYNAAKRLVGLGYKHVYWYRDGVEGWQANHDTRVVRPDRAWVDALPKDMTQ